MTHSSDKNAPDMMEPLRMTETSEFIERNVPHLQSRCPQCSDTGNPVTPDNAVSVPDAAGNIVMLHKTCVPAWLTEQVNSEK
jgi:hypothetical protein